jgi:acyl carrier protein
MTTTFDGLRDIIVRDYQLPSEALTPDTVLREIEIDSLGVIELIFSLEDRFKVTATDTAKEFDTLGDIANYIDRLIAERDARQANEESVIAAGEETRE